MTRKRTLIFIVAVVLLLALSVSLAMSAPQKTPQPPKFVLSGDKAPAFTAKDRALVGTYYEHLRSTMSPGSLAASTFSPDVERSLVAGSRLPMQFEKDLEALPVKLEAELSQLTGDYGRYRLGTYVLLIKKADLTIFDVAKNAGSK